MSGSQAVSFFKHMAQMVWHLICVVMLTAFLGLVAVHDDYYAGGSEGAGPLIMPLAVGAILSLVVVLTHLVRWRRRLPS